MKKKSKGGKRVGAGRPKMPEAMETVSIRVKTSDVKKWGGRDKLRVKLCEFVTFPGSFSQVAFFEPGKGITEVRDLKEGEVTLPVQVTLSKPAVSSLKPQEQPKADLATNHTKEDILKQISAIRAEKVPKERDTVFGRKSWALEQKKRIEDLEKQLK